MTCISPVSLTLKSICELSTFFFSKCNVDYNFEFNSCPSISFRRRQWHPTPVLLPGKSHGWRSLVGCTPCKGSDTAERLPFHFSLSCTGEGNGNPLRCSCLENPRTGEPGGLPSLGSHRVGHDWSDLAAARPSTYLFFTHFSLLLPPRRHSHYPESFVHSAHACF